MFYFNRAERLIPSVVLMAQLSGHSARVGSVIEQFKNNIKPYAVQMSGGWNSPLMPVHYGKQISTKNSGSAQLSKLSGR